MRICIDVLKGSDYAMRVQHAEDLHTLLCTCVCVRVCVCVCVCVCACVCHVCTQDIYAHNACTPNTSHTSDYHTRQLTVVSGDAAN